MAVNYADVLDAELFKKNVRNEYGFCKILQPLYKSDDVFTYERNFCEVLFYNNLC